MASNLDTINLVDAIIVATGTNIPRAWHMPTNLGQIGPQNGPKVPKQA